MKIVSVVSLILISNGVCFAQKHRNQEPFPAEVVIGRDSFIDIGPPFNYYDLTFLISRGDETDVERVSLTPPADACYPRAEIKVAHVVLHESLSSLLQTTNPCNIPERALSAERKRRKKGLPVFSGMNISMQVQCADRTRLISADILDRDIFDQHPNTPRYTAWSRSLFEKLDQATGDRPWDTPIFTVADTASPASSTSQSANMQAIADGKYDSIFGNNSDRPSELYRLAQNAPRQPFIELTKSDPVRPAFYVDPVYPPIAKIAHVHGTVEFRLSVGDDGLAKNVSIDSGPKMLWQASTEAIAKWKFSPGDAGKVVLGSIRFGLNCASDSR
jgi:Gram-negative bacterial TonB protein C-terminal